jgi:hypothetical protein
MNVELKGYLKNNLYLQVFSNKNNLFRIFVYKVKKITKLSLEIIFDKNIDKNKEINFAIKILKYHLISITNHEYATEKKKLDTCYFQPMTIKNLKIMKSLNLARQYFQVAGNLLVEKIR